MLINILGKPGPRSIEGKKKSSMNAVKSGAFAKSKILPHECEQEYDRLRRELTKSFKPSCAAEKILIEQMVEALWSVERFKLRLTYKRENIFKELTPRHLAMLIPVPEMMIEYAPDYLLHTNTKFPAKEIRALFPAWKEYVHFVKNALGARNYDMVYQRYVVLYQKLDEYMRQEHERPLLMTHQKNIELEFQQQPELFLQFMHEFGAWMYYRINFQELKPKIRVAMSMWFYLERNGNKEAGLQDEGVLRELKRYLSLQEAYLNLQKSLNQSQLARMTISAPREISNEPTINSIETSA